MKSVARKTWGDVALGEIVTLNYGKALPLEMRNRDGVVPVYGANGVKDATDRHYTEGPTLVIGRKGSAGQVTRVDGPFWPLDVSYFTSHDRSRLNFEFLHYTLNNLDLPKLARGVKPGINRNDVYALRIPLPPLEEQRRIVAILDDAFEGMGRARALVEANLRDAWELFQSILSASLLKTGWQKVSFGSLCNVIAGQSPRSSFYNTQGQGLPFYQGKKEFTDRLLGQPTTWTTNVTKVAEAGDVLMSVRAPVGPINQATEKICIGRGLAAIRPNDSLNRDYLWYALMWLQPTIGGQVGAVFDSINKSTIESLKIPYPPLEEQRQVVAILDEVSDSLTLARNQMEATLADIEEVRQSALKRAFAGNLA